MDDVTMTAGVARQLREPFPAEHVGKLPRIWCRNCRDAAKRGGVCAQHRKARCRGCNNNITDAHLHLDYVGHAEVTDRFLQVDPQWDWEPFAIGSDGLPAIDKYGGLWIRLTIAGKTRVGYGHADGKEGPDAIKEAIGDALRNAGMRFGVGLDLWGATFKEQNEHPDEDPSAPDPKAVRDWATDKARTAADLQQGSARLAETGAGEVVVTNEHGDEETLAELFARRLNELQTPAPDAEQVEPSHEQPTNGRGPSQQRLTKMHALFGEAGMGGENKRGERLMQMSLVAGRDINSSKELSDREIDKVISALQTQVAQSEKEQVAA